jgi:hypothetical protein
MIIGKDKSGLIGLFSTGRLNIVTGIFVKTSGEIINDELESTVSVISTTDKVKEAIDYSWEDVRNKLGRNLEHVEPSYDKTSD